VPRHENALRSLAAGLGLSLVALGFVGLHDFLVRPSSRFLPPTLAFSIFGWPVALAAGAVLLLLRNPRSAGVNALPARRGPLVCLAVGGALLILGAAGWVWRHFAQQETGFLGSVLYILTFPPGLSLTLIGAALWLYRRSRGSAL
jgi:hypothetical protein